MMGAPPVGLRIDVTRVLADFRVNLTVRAEDYELAVTSGALFDEINGVLFVPPRIDLKPLEKWLPFDLSRMQREEGAQGGGQTEKYSDHRSTCAQLRQSGVPRLEPERPPVWGRSPVLRPEEGGVDPAAIAGAGRRFRSPAAPGMVPGAQPRSCR